MKHDLKAINAAIRLGDVFVPPVGTRFYVPWYKGRAFEVMGLHPDKAWPFVVMECRRVHGANGVERSDKNVFWTPLSLQEIAHVPPDAPPFRDWERP